MVPTTTPTKTQEKGKADASAPAFLPVRRVAPQQSPITQHHAGATLACQENLPAQKDGRRGGPAGSNLFGVILRRRRRDLGLTQGQVARLVGVSRPAVCQWETGKCFPALPHTASLCELLHLSPSLVIAAAGWSQ